MTGGRAGWQTCEWAIGGDDDGGGYSGSPRDHQVAKLVLGVAVNAPAGLRGIHVHHLGS